MSIHEPTIVLKPKPVDEATRQRAEKLFPRLQRSSELYTRNMSAAREEWVMLYASVDEATRLGGRCKIPTGNRGGVNQGIRRQCLAAALDTRILIAQPKADNVRGIFSPGKNWR